MRRAVFFILFFGILAARADVVIQQKVVSKTHNGDLTIKIKGNKIRVDVDNGPSGNTSKIWDLDSDLVITLTHKEKTMKKLSFAEMNDLAEQIKLNQHIKSTDEVPTFEDSGKSEVVSGFNTEIYTWTNSAYSAGGSVWVANDFPDFAGIKPYIEMLNNGPVFHFARGMFPDTAKLPGMVIQSKALIEGQEVDTTLISAHEESIDPSVFEAPIDYKE
jgi:hypothetical protein